MDDLISRKAVIEGINYLSAFYRANYKKEPPISAIIDGINNMSVEKACEGCIREYQVYIGSCASCSRYWKDLYEGLTNDLS